MCEKRSAVLVQGQGIEKTLLLTRDLDAGTCMYICTKTDGCTYLRGKALQNFAVSESYTRRGMAYS